MSCSPCFADVISTGASRPFAMRSGEIPAFRRCGYILDGAEECGDLSTTSAKCADFGRDDTRRNKRKHAQTFLGDWTWAYNFAMQESETSTFGEDDPRRDLWNLERLRAYRKRDPEFKAAKADFVTAE